MPVSIWLDPSSSLGYSPKILPFCSSVASLPDLESMLVNEFLIQKLKRFACAFIEISLFYTTINQSEKEFLISIVPRTRSINRQRALIH